MTVLGSINSKSINFDRFVLDWITGQLKRVLTLGLLITLSINTKRIFGHLWIDSFAHLDHVTVSMFTLLTVLNNILFNSLANEHIWDRTGGVDEFSELIWWALSDKQKVGGLCQDSWCLICWNDQLINQQIWYNRCL